MQILDSLIRTKNVYIFQANLTKIFFLPSPEDTFLIFYWEKQLNIDVGLIVLFTWEEDTGDVSNNLTKFFKFQALSETNSGKSEQGKSGKVGHFSSGGSFKSLKETEYSFLLEILSIEVMIMIYKMTQESFTIITIISHGDNDNKESVSFVVVCLR